MNFHAYDSSNRFTEEKSRMGARFGTEHIFKGRREDGKKGN
jgi:hypothetical protein